MIDDRDPRPPDEARILPIGEPIEGGDALFEGTLAGAREFLLGLAEEERARVSIWTPGHIFGARELLAERPGHEHDA